MVLVWAIVNQTFAAIAFTTMHSDLSSFFKLWRLDLLNPIYISSEFAALDGEEFTCEPDPDNNLNKSIYYGTSSITNEGNMTLNYLENYL